MKVLLYINGYAYSSTIVYLKEGVESRIYYICRDYLGSITRLANANGGLAQELIRDNGVWKNITIYWKSSCEVWEWTIFYGFKSFGLYSRSDFKKII